MKVLQLTYRVPFPPTDGGAIGIYNITKGLSDNGCEIDLIAINTPKHTQPADAMLGMVNKQVDVFVDTSISVFKLIRNVLFRSIPYNIERFISKAVSDELKQLLTENNYDFIQIEGAFVAYYIDEIKKQTTAPIIVRTHNIEYVIWERLSLNESNWIKRYFYGHLAKRLKRFESVYYNKADGIAAITEEDKERLQGLNVTTPIEVIPAGVQLNSFKLKIEQKNDTVFSISALDWIPNIEGLNWFFETIWNGVLERKPSVQLHIAGKSTPDWLLNTNYPNTTIHGFVDDAAVFKQTYQLMLVPLLSGGGMRVKIVEGLALGKCIISTTIGAEGIDYSDRKNIVIADTPEEWIDAICYYLEHQNERMAIEANALDLANSHYENKAVTKKYIDLFSKIKQ
ncbi:MAG: glycosyltransferase family 4 protein [Crocinitomicaceae bacterium]|nr:glycosyltransferase family 4 protein [Crocinitomicaceae bacterium]